VCNAGPSGVLSQPLEINVAYWKMNPIENIRKIRTVVAAGRVFDRQELDAVRADIESSASRWTGTPTR